MTLLFDQVTRTDASPSRHSEPTFHFLNRARGTFWADVRDLLEAWCAELPATARRDVVRRLQSSDSRAFDGAFWELYLFQTLLRSGYEVTCHPPMRGSAKKPDFLAVSEHTSFYLEAKSVSPGAPQGAERRMNQVYDALNRLDCPDYFLRVEVERQGARDMKVSQLRRRVQEWLNGLDYDALVDTLGTDQSLWDLESLEWEDGDGWTLSLWVIPRSADARGKPEIQPLGMLGSSGASVIDDASPLRHALKAKGRAYGDMDLPYVVALKLNRLLGDENLAVMNALDGSWKVEIASAPDGSMRYKDVRAPDGFWYGGDRWRHRHVSAVLLGLNLSFWNMTRSAPTCWLHPDPELEFQPPLCWRIARHVGTQIDFIDAEIGGHALLGLPDVWGTGDPFEDD